MFKILDYYEDGRLCHLFSTLEYISTYVLVIAVRLGKILGLIDKDSVDDIIK